MARSLGRDWLSARLEGAPAELVGRTVDFVVQAGHQSDPDGLARAGRLALDRAVAGSPDRRAALDLLAADALVTLALAAQVDAEPERLEWFAGHLLDLGSRGP
jgi:hypothetical protein